MAFCTRWLWLGSSVAWNFAWGRRTVLRHGGKTWRQSAYCQETDCPQTSLPIKHYIHWGKVLNCTLTICQILSDGMGSKVALYPKVTVTQISDGTCWQGCTRGCLLPSSCTGLIRRWKYRWESGENPQKHEVLVHSWPRKKFRCGKIIYHWGRRVI